MRPGKDEYFLQMAELVSTRSTCLRRHVGCVVVDYNSHVIATGYNGVASGMDHCNQKSMLRYVDLSPEVIYPYACEGANSPSGEDLEKCHAIHAEQNALLQCNDVQDIDTIYCTVSPCMTCMKLILNTSTQRVVYRGVYNHEGVFKLAMAQGIKMVHHLDEAAE